MAQRLSILQEDLKNYESFISEISLYNRDLATSIHIGLSNNDPQTIDYLHESGIIEGAGTRFKRGAEAGREVYKAAGMGKLGRFFGAEIPFALGGGAAGVMFGKDEEPKAEKKETEVETPKSGSGEGSGSGAPGGGININVSPNISPTMTQTASPKISNINTADSAAAAAAGAGATVATFGRDSGAGSAPTPAPAPKPKPKPTPKPSPSPAPGGESPSPTPKPEPSPAPKPEPSPAPGGESPSPKPPKPRGPMGVPLFPGQGRAPDIKDLPTPSTPSGPSMQEPSIPQPKPGETIKLPKDLFARESGPSVEKAPIAGLLPAAKKELPAAKKELPPGNQGGGQLALPPGRGEAGTGKDYQGHLFHGFEHHKSVLKQRADTARGKGNDVEAARLEADREKLGRFSTGRTEGGDGQRYYPHGDMMRRKALEARRAKANNQVPAGGQLSLFAHYEPNTSTKSLIEGVDNKIGNQLASRSADNISSILKLDVSSGETVNAALALGSLIDR